MRGENMEGKNEERKGDMEIREEKILKRENIDKGRC